MRTSDILNPDPLLELQKHKLKRLVKSPNSYFMDVRCPGCHQVTVIFSNTQSVGFCGNCRSILSQPTGGHCILVEGCSFRRKSD